MKQALLLMLLMAFSFVSCRNEPPASQEPAVTTTAKVETDIPQPELVEQTRPVHLFFAHPTRYGLAVETRQVFELPDQTAMLKQVLTTLERGPLGNLLPTVPASLSISNVYTVDDMIYVNLKRKDNPALIGGVEGEALFIHSITNTALAVYPKQFFRVRFLVNGLETDTLMGHFDGHQTYTYSRAIIQR